MRRCLYLHVSEQRLHEFLDVNGGFRAFVFRWRTLEDVLDIANAAVVCFEMPTNPLFSDQRCYFSFFADILTAIESNEVVIGVVIRDDVFQFKFGHSEYTLCRRYNGRTIMWLVTRVHYVSIQGAQSESSERIAGRAFGSECDESLAHPSEH